MQLFVSIHPPYRWARIDKKGKVVNGGIFHHLKEVTTYRRDSVIFVVPGEDYLTHQVEVPTRKRKKLQAAIPFALEVVLSDDIENLSFHVLEWQPGSPALVAVISYAKLDQWRAIAQENQVDPAGIVADYQLMPLLTETTGSIALTDNERICLYFADKTGVALDDATFELWWQNRAHQIETETWQFSSHELSMQLGASQSGRNLGEHFVAWLKQWPGNQPITGILYGLLDVKGANKDKGVFKTAAVIAFLAILIRLGFDGYQLYELERKNNVLDKEIETLLSNTFPHVEKIVNAKLQLERELDAFEQGTGKDDGHFQPLLYLVSNALKSARAKLEEVNYKAPELTIYCSAKDFAALDQLKNQLSEQPGLIAKLISSGSLENRVTGRFSLQLI